MNPASASPIPAAPGARTPGCVANAASRSYSPMRVSRSPLLIPSTIVASTCCGVAVRVATVVDMTAPFEIQLCVTEFDDHTPWSRIWQDSRHEDESPNTTAQAQVRAEE